MNLLPSRRLFLKSLAASGLVASLPRPLLQAAEPESRLGWAIVGLGGFSMGQMLPNFKHCEHSRPVALVSGHPDKAARMASEYGIAKDAIYNYENFDTIAKNPEVDVVYIALPNSMHAEYTIRALKAGKHVLCEKPMAVTVAECEAMIAAAKAADRKLGIAYRLHFEPMNLKAMELCRTGAIGKMKSFTSDMCFNLGAPNIRLQAALGGGPLGDVGVYIINAARYTLGEEPIEVSAMEYWAKDDPRFREVPESVAFLMKFPSGALADCFCSFGSSGSARYRVLGTKGFIEMDPAYWYGGLKLRMENQDGPWEATGLLAAPFNQFAAEIDGFSLAVLKNEAPRTPGEEGLADIRVTTAIEQAAKSRATVKVG